MQKANFDPLTDQPKGRLMLFLRKYRVVAHIFFWIWVYLIDVFIFGVGYQDVPKFVLMAALEMPGQMLLAYSTAYWILPRYLQQFNHFESIAIFLFVFVVNGFIGHTLLFVTDAYNPPVPFGDIPSILLMALYCFLKACFFIGIKVVIGWYEAQKKMS